MELLDRYLKSVQWWLPKGQREDIIAELSEDIRSQIDDRQIELGRELSEEEVSAILERLGRPEVVAQRYLPQSYLIGPTMFPIYRFVLKLVLLVYLVPGLLVWISLILFDPSYRAAHPGFGLLGGLESLWHIALSAFTFITVGFALVEWSRAQAGKPKEWGLRELPEVRDEDRIPRSESLGELAGYLVFFLWWLDVLPSPSVPELRITLAPIWQTLYWPILLLALAGAVMACVNLLRPYWTRRRAGISLAIESASVVVLLLLLRAGTLIEVALPGQPLATLEDVAKLELFTRWINLSLAVILAVIAVLCALDGVRAARRLWGKGRLIPLARQSL
jgi:HAAS domain-containing protein